MRLLHRRISLRREGRLLRDLDRDVRRALGSQKPCRPRSFCGDELHARAHRARPVGLRARSDPRFLVIPRRKPAPGAAPLKPRSFLFRVASTAIAKCSANGSKRRFERGQRIVDEMGLGGTAGTNPDCTPGAVSRLVTRSANSGSSGLVSRAGGMTRCARGGSPPLLAGPCPQVMFAITVGPLPPPGAPGCAHR